MDASRRELIGRGLCACGLGLVGWPASARELPVHTLTPVVTRDYAPQALDERGLWDACDALEDELGASNLRIRDPQVNEYLLGIVQRLMPDHADRIRLFAMRNPDFNAAMFPNGMMIVNSGFLARARNEAQLAAVIGHEAGHYLRRHSLQSWRNQRATSAFMAFIAVAGAGASGYSGGNWYDLANAINSGLLLSVFQYNRELESEADAYGLKLMVEAGYAPGEAARIWHQLIEERKASAAARKKRYQDGSSSALSTHPPSVERMENLAQTSAKIERAQAGGTTLDEGRARWLAASAAIRPWLIEEQIKLNDPGASLYLIESLATDGWDSSLRFYEGEAYRLRDEAGDADRAAAAYAAAPGFSEPWPEAFRAHGYAQIKRAELASGREALRRYLELRPDASDAEMVRFTLEQQ